MNYFENQPLNNDNNNDLMIVDGIIRLKACDALTTKIDLSVAYAALEQQRREGGENIT